MLLVVGATSSAVVLITFTATKVDGVECQALYQM